MRIGRRWADHAAALLLWAAASPAAAADWSHDIDVTLDPARHRLSASDLLVAGGEPGSPRARLSFRLHADLRITSLTLEGREVVGEVRPAGGGAPLAVRGLTAYGGPPVPPGARLRLAYEGTLPEMIGPDGILLRGATGWVPLIDTAGADLCLYNVTARLPEPWRAVTRGRRQQPEGRPPRGVSIARYAAEAVSEAPTLLAGPYAVRSITHRGVILSAHFLSEAAGGAEPFLDAAARQLDHFSSMLVPYPHSRLDLVESDLAAGHVLPTFVLLAPEEVRQGAAALKSGALEHRILHSWWGGAVDPDAGAGGWREGLTTYLADHLSLEQREGPRAAADQRRLLAQDPGGAGKDALVFHMLRRMAGDELFFETLRSVAADVGGRRASWEVVRRSFERATGRDLAGFFDQWIGRPGLPALGLGEAASVRTGGSYLVTGTLLQEGADAALYHLPVPLVLMTARGRREHLIDVAGRSASFSLPADAVPIEIALDPDAHVPKSLAERSRVLLVPNITSGAGGIDRAALADRARALAWMPAQGPRPLDEDPGTSAASIEIALGVLGVAPGDALLPFAEGFRHRFALHHVEEGALGPTAEIRVRRPSGDTLFPARLFPFVPAAGAGKPALRTDQAVFLEPEDLAWLAEAPSPPKLDSGIAFTVERPGTGAADAGSHLADVVAGAAKLGAAALVILKAAEGPSLHERSLTLPLPIAGPVPGLLVLSAEPDLGSEILGRGLFTRFASPPTVRSEPGYRPVLLEMEITLDASAPVARVPMVNLVGCLEGSDAGLRGEVVIAAVSHAGQGGAARAAALLEVSRLLADPARGPARGVLLAFLDGGERGLAGSRALLDRLPESGLRPVAAVGIDLAGPAPAARIGLIGGTRHPEIRAAVEKLAELLGLELDSPQAASAAGPGGAADSFELAGIPAVWLAAAQGDPNDPAGLETAARLAAQAVWTLAN